MNEDLIEVNPAVMMGKPVVRGTRIQVETILEELAGGATEDNLLAAHPRLRRQGIRAALAYAAQTLRADVVYPPTGAPA